MDFNAEVGIKRLTKDAILPFYARVGDAGMDICAAEEVLLSPGETKAVSTGLSFILPKGMEIQVRPRSGLSLKTPLRLANSPGTIDSGYKDELRVILHNSSCVCNDEKEIYTLDETDNRKGTYKIQVGDRIAQIVFAKVSHVTLQEASDVIERIRSAEDRGGGFGSTGIKA